MTSATPGTVRRPGLDLLRVLGIVAIVAGHVWADEDLRRVIYPWHVPVFFVISGYLWPRERPLRTEVARRASSLLRPYLFWLVAIGAVVTVTGTLSTGSLPLGAGVRMLWGGSLLGRPFSAFWFVTVLFVTAVLYRALQIAFRDGVVPGLLVGVAGVVLASAAPESARSTPWGLGLVPACLLFVVVGDLARRHLSTRPRAGVVGASLVAAGLVGVWVLPAPPDLKAADFGTPMAGLAVSIVLSVGLVLLLDRGLTSWPTSVARASTILAGPGLMVVLTHAFVLDVLDTPATGRWSDFVVALVVPWALALLAARSRASAWLTGAPPRSRRPRGDRVPPA